MRWKKTHICEINCRPQPSKPFLYLFSFTIRELPKENENQMFVNEMKHFIRCIKGKEASMNDLASAAEVLEVALACHTAAERKRVVYL